MIFLRKSVFMKFTPSPHSIKNLYNRPGNYSGFYAKLLRKLSIVYFDKAKVL